MLDTSDPLAQALTPEARAEIDAALLRAQRARMRRIFPTATQEQIDRAAWAPQPGSQVVFCKSRIFETLYEGTRGPGKTDALIMDFLQDVGKGYGAEWRGILFRQTFPQLADVIAKTTKWIKLMWPAAQYNKAEHTWTFPDGEQLLLRHMKDPEDYWNYHGHAYPWIGWEELTNWKDDQCYRRMMSCCRSTVPGIPRKYRATTNPYGIGHNWVKKRFRLPEMRGELIADARDADGNLEPKRIAIHGSLSENRILLDADPQYVSRLRAAARNPAELAAWLRGSWDITSGGMFDDLWDAKRHVVDAFDIPATWRITRSLDWGSAKPASVGWWAESDGCDVRLRDGRRRSTVRGDRFRIAEWYLSTGRTNEGLKLPAADVAAGIAEREINMGLRDARGRPTRVLPGAADAAIWNSEPGFPSVYEELSKPVRVRGVEMPGATFEPSDKRPGSRKNGWERIRTMLRSAVPPDGGVREGPGLFVFRECQKFIELVPSLPRDDKDPDDVDTDAEDHIGDEARYELCTPKRVSRSGRHTAAR